MADTSTGKKINVFAKAKGKVAAEPTKSKRKETVWAITPMIPDQPTREQLNQSVSEMHRLHGERKRVETEEGVHKSALKQFAEEQYIAHLAATGAEPESPLKVINDKMQSVTFVIQDRGYLTKVSDEQLAALTELLGEDAASELVYDGGDFKFDAGIMGMAARATPPGASPPEGLTVQNVVAEAITEMLGGLVESGKLTQEQADGLIRFEAERRFKPQVLSRAVGACGRNRAKLAQFLDVLGSAVTRYVKC